MATLLRRQQLVADGLYAQAHGAVAAGFTGVGKTYLIRTMSRMCGLPFAEANATQYTDAGYIGLNLPQMFIPLIWEAVRMQHDERVMEDMVAGLGLTHKDQVPSLTKLPDEVLDPAIELAESGVMLLDEFDKWMIQGDDQGGRNVGRKLQAELLQMLEGGQFFVSDQEEELGIPFNTTKVLIICTGAFVGLDQIISKRLNADLRGNPATWEKTTPDDFMRYGVIPELAGRLSTHVMFKPLNDIHLAGILMEEGGLVDEYTHRFEAEGSQLKVTDDGLRTLAREAIQRGTGARGLRHVMERTFTKALFEASKRPVKAILDVQAARRQEARVEELDG